MAGEIVHLELPSRSFERSATFYGKVFGWHADGAQSGGHLRFATSGDGAAGVRGSWVLHALAQAPGPLPFVAVDDIDATLAEVERQGGRVLVPRLALAGQGEFGLLADPDGNVMAVLAKKAGAAGAAGAVGAIAASGAGSRPGASTPAGNAAVASHQPAAAATPAEPAKASVVKTGGATRAKPAAAAKSSDSQGKSAPGGRVATGKAAAKPAPRRKR